MLTVLGGVLPEPPPPALSTFANRLPNDFSNPEVTLTLLSRALSDASSVFSRFSKPCIDANCAPTPDFLLSNSRDPNKEKTHHRIAFIEIETQMENRMGGQRKVAILVVVKSWPNTGHLHVCIQ